MKTKKQHNFQHIPKYQSHVEGSKLLEVLLLHNFEGQRLPVQNLSKWILTCNDLDDTIPNIVLNFCILDKFNNHIHIPNEIFGKFFRQNCDFEH